MELNYQEWGTVTSKRCVPLFKMLSRVFMVCLTIGTVMAEPNPWQKDQWYPEWSESVRYLEPHEYQEEEAHTFGIAYRTTSHELDGELRKNYEVTKWHSDDLFPWVAVIYGNTDLASQSRKDWAGHCGAVLITTNTLITICGCVASYVRWLELIYLDNADSSGRPHRHGHGKTPTHPFQVAPESVFGFDIPTEDIYVFYDHMEFFLSQQDPNCKISKPAGIGDQELHPQLQGNANFLCNQALKASRISQKDKDFPQRTTIAILNFDSHLNNQETHLPWPPVPYLYDDMVNYKNTRNRVPNSLDAIHPSYMHHCCVIPPGGGQYQIIYIDNYGNLVDPGDLLLWRELSLVNLDECGSINKCFRKSANCEYAKKWNLLDDMLCYKTSFKPQICEGSIGSPLVTYSSIIGLATYTYTCDHNPKFAMVPVLALTPFLTNYIEYVIAQYGVNASLVDSSLESQDRYHLIRQVEQDYFKTYHLNEPEFYYDDTMPNEANKDVNQFSQMISASLNPHCLDHNLSWITLAFLLLNNK